MMSTYEKIMSLSEKYKKLALMEERKGNLEAANAYWADRREARKEADLAYLLYLGEVVQKKKTR